MAYEAPITIRKAIDNIRKRKYVLPSIQREFVWDTDQIEKLFDSLMRDYPISTFLFWKIEKSKIRDFQFYFFLQNYHEQKAKHNIKADLPEDEDIIAILDGQQRMTSMYIALTGSYATKILYRRKNDKDAYPKKKLYLNLLSKSSDLECEYHFKFLIESEVENNDTTHWFCVQDIMSFEEVSETMTYLMDKGLTDTSVYEKERSNYALKTLNLLYNVIHQKGNISFFLEESEELDKVLQIFIRINSGGTKLSYSDLLLSIATAKWKEKDAREVIHEFVDSINSVGDGFKFNKDFVLKSCLVLSDLKDIKFKVDNFTRENMLLIESEWENIASALNKAIELVAKFGYNKDNLIATNALIPIAYFIKKNNYDSSIVHSKSRSDDRKAIKEWLARVFLKGTFGGQPDSLYPIMRNLIKDNLGVFPLEQIIKHYKGKTKSILFNIEEIDNILQLKYGKAKTINALSLLYPSLNHSFRYHQDHIHPKSFFTKKQLIKRGVEDRDQRIEYTDRYNDLPNLQLLQANENIEKSNKPFKDWLKEVYPTKEAADAFLIQNHIDPSSSLEFEDFIAFFEARKKRLRQQLMTILKVKEQVTTDIID